MIDVHNWGYAQVFFLFFWLSAFVATLRRFKDPDYIRYLNAKSKHQGSEFVLDSTLKRIRTASVVAAFSIEMAIIVAGGFFK